MKKFCALRKDRTLTLFLILTISGWCWSAVPEIRADSRHESSTDTPENESFFLERTIGLYQKLLSGADGQRCPMYPSCSSYAKQAFHAHGPIKGWILTADRLLRCGHDEVELSGRKKINGQHVTPDPLKNNDFLFR